jgi:hypothetical protein
VVAGWLGAGWDEPLKRSEDTSSAATTSEIVIARSRRGVSQDMWCAASHERAPEAAATAVIAQAEHIALQGTSIAATRAPT